MSSPKEVLGIITQYIAANALGVYRVNHQQAEDTRDRIMREIDLVKKHYGQSES